MTASNDDQFNDLIVDCLIAHQEQLDSHLPAGTERSADTPIAETALPPDQRERLERAKRCIDVLVALAGRPTSPDGLPDLQPSKTEAAPPKVLGRFEILDELGSGGFGIVYRAWDPRTQRQVALKIPRFEALVSPELQARFEQEARAAAKLDHPHIVTVLEAGVDGVVPFIVSQFCPGITLTQWLHDQRGPIEPRVTAEIVRSLAEAVAHAHDRGVLHRDIKPSNVLMGAARPGGEVAADNELVPKLVDFGLAKLTDAERDMTQTGALLGTIRYMAPELASGSRKQAGPAVDIYSLGALLYELLTGAPPFAADSDLDVLRNIGTREPSRIRATRPKVPTSLETICLKCLEKTPARRYASAQALADDLGRYLAGRPIAARPASTPEVVWKWARRRPAVAALLGVSLLSIIGALVGVSIYNLQLRERAVEVAASNLRLREMTEQALANESRAQELLYVADIQLAQQAWERNNIGLLEETLERHRPVGDEPDRRGVEWYYLANRTNDEAIDLPTEEGDANCARFSPDGRLLATAGRDGRLRLWNATTGSLRATIEEPQKGELNDVRFSPDGKIMAVASDRRRILLCDVEQEVLTGTLEGGHTQWVGGVDFTPAGDLLGSVGADGQIILWDWQRREVKKVIPAFDRELRAIRFIDDGKFAVVAEEWGAPRIWDLEENRIVTTLTMKEQVPGGNKVWPRMLAVSRDAQRLAVAHVNGGVRVWDISQPARPQLVEAFDEGSARAIDFLEPNRILVGYDDHLGRVWQLGQDQPPRLLRGHELQLTFACASPDGKRIATGSREGTQRIWSATPRDESPPLARFSGVPLSLAASPRDDELALATASPAAVHLLHPITGKPTRGPLTGMLNEPQWVAYSRDGKYLAVMTADGTVHIFGAGENAPLWSCLCAPDTQPVLLHSPAEDLLIVLANKQVWCIDLSLRQIRWERTFSDGIWCVDFEPEGKLLYIGNQVGVTHELRAADGATEREFKQYKEPVEFLAVAPDGKHLVTSSPDRTMLLRNLSTGEVLRRLPTTDKKTTAPGFTRDGRTLIAVEDLAYIGFWQVATGQHLLRLGPWGDGHYVLWKRSSDGRTCYFTDAAFDANPPYLILRTLRFPDVPPAGN